MSAGGQNKFDTSMRWIADETKVHETSDFGGNRKSVTDNIADQQHRLMLVQQYKAQMNQAARSAQTSDASSKLRQSYDDLVHVAEHRHKCLKTVGQIASLEDTLNSLSVEFAKRATTLVNHAALQTATPTHVTQGEGAEHVARAAHECILSVRNNWKWISKLVKCSEVHLQHVSDYHQFFHEAEEYEGWMTGELAHQLKILEKLDPTTTDSQKFVQTIKTALSTFLTWQIKSVDLFERSRRILPVNLRTSKLETFRPVTALCDYQTREINIRDTEELTLLDSSNHELWRIRNIHGHEASVPSIILQMPGTANEAVAVGNRLRIKLLTLWTACVKLAGQRIISRLIWIIKEWSLDQEGKLKALTKRDKDTILELFRLLHEVFGFSWEQYEDFMTLCKREESTRSLLGQEGSVANRDSEFSNALLSDLKDVESILISYREFWSYWETFKILTESTEHRDMMLLPSNWEEWQYFSTSEILRKLKIGVEFEETTEEAEDETVDGEWHTEEEVVTDSHELMHAEQEEKKTFVITESGRLEEVTTVVRRRGAKKNKPQAKRTRTQATSTSDLDMLLVDVMSKTAPAKEYVSTAVMADLVLPHEDAMTEADEALLFGLPEPLIERIYRSRHKTRARSSQTEEKESADVSVQTDVVTEQVVRTVTRTTKDSENMVEIDTGRSLPSVTQHGPGEQHRRSGSEADLSSGSDQEFADMLSLDERERKPTFTTFKGGSMQRKTVTGSYFEDEIAKGEKRKGKHTYSQRFGAKSKSKASIFESLRGRHTEVTYELEDCDGSEISYGDESDGVEGAVELGAYDNTLWYTTHRSEEQGYTEDGVYGAGQVQLSGDGRWAHKIQSREIWTQTDATTAGGFAGAVIISTAGHDTTDFDAVGAKVGLTEEELRVGLADAFDGSDDESVASDDSALAACCCGCCGCLRKASLLDLLLQLLLLLLLLLFTLFPFGGGYVCDIYTNTMILSGNSYLKYVAGEPPV